MAKKTTMQQAENGGVHVLTDRYPIRHIWALTCGSWGIHRVFGTKREAITDEREQRSEMPHDWCGPHRIVRLTE